MSAGVISVPTIMPLRVPVAGKPKNLIDTNTLIELKSETKSAKIFYTVDNTRPNPDKCLGENTTLLYTEPFMLHSGKRTVKALAQNRDYRESNVVTKTFNVEYAEPTTPPTSDSEVDDGTNFQADMVRKNKILSNRMTSSVLEGNPISVKDASPDYIVPQLQGLSTNPSRQRSRPSSVRSIGMTETVNEKHIKRCVYCNASRPHSSKSRFCSECGKPVPVEPGSADVEPASMGMCPSCRSYVPLNQPMCIVCEEPMKKFTKTTSTVRYEDKIICGSCGKQNPPTLTHCSFCEHRFPMAIHTGEVAPPLPQLNGRLIRCPTCTRVNNPDARFCDWCGSKPLPEQSPLTCSLCKTNSPPYSRYCGHCGSTFVPPNRLDPRNSELGDEMCDTFQFTNLPMWKGVPYPSVPRSPQSPRLIPAPRKSKKNIHTQTVGLFYPGGKKIHRDQEEIMDMRNTQLRMSDKQPPLTAVSPGRGYWRKQFDHICGHVKAYTTNNVEFRSIIAEPRLGKVTGAGIDELENGLTISFTFNMYDTEDANQQSKNLQRDIYKQHKQFAFGSTLKEDSEKENKAGKKKKTNKKKKNLTTRIENNSKPEDRLLLKEVSAGGSGRVSEVKQLIMEGADVNCTDNEKRTPLALAVSSTLTDCVKSLIHAGAKVNMTSGPNADTPLHEAVKLGPSGKNIIEILLSKDANMLIKNAKGLTPYDMAVKADLNSITAMFNTHKGKKLVDKMVLPKQYKKHEIVSDEESMSEDDAAVF